MNILEFYARLRNATNGLPEWTSLHPQHQHQVISAVNLLLSVCYDNNVTGKSTEDKS